MHLSVDADLPAADAFLALIAACRARGLRVSRSEALPRPPGGRAAFVIEPADPLPSVPSTPSSDAMTDSAARSGYPLSVFETGPGRCRLSTLHPTTLVDLLGHPEAAAAALELEKTLHAVLAIAAGRAPPDDDAG